MDESQEIDIQRQGLKGLMLIVDTLKTYPGTGQGYRLLRFLAGLYNGADYPFDLTALRGLDQRLADACLALLSLDRLGWREVHTWGVVDGPTLEGWFAEAGLRREALGRALARRLYQDKYGADGHPEGTDWP